MLVSELDGYLAGILVCPDLLMPSEWLPPIWGGGDHETAPVFESQEELQQLLDAIMQHYNAIARELHRGGDHYTPIYDVDERHDEILWELWASGFGRAMALRPKAWATVLENGEEDARTALAGLVTLVAIADGESKLEQTDAYSLTAAAPDQIPRWVRQLNAWRRASVSGSDLAGPVPSRKAGRNEPCPCGSGRKYKRCCGAN